MILLILFILALLVEKIWSPRVEYNEIESLLIIFYSAKNTRKRLIFKI